MAELLVSALAKREKEEASLGNGVVRGLTSSCWAKTVLAGGVGACWRKEEVKVWLAGVVEEMVEGEGGRVRRKEGRGKERGEREKREKERKNEFFRVKILNL